MHPDLRERKREREYLHILCLYNTQKFQHLVQQKLVYCRNNKFWNISLHSYTCSIYKYYWTFHFIWCIKLTQTIQVIHVGYTHMAGMLQKSPCLEKSQLSKRSQLSWNITLCNRVSTFWHFKGLQCLHLHVQVLQEDPMTQCNIPKDLNSLQQWCDNFVSPTYCYFTSNTVGLVKNSGMHSSGVHSWRRWIEDGYSAGTQFVRTYLHSTERSVRRDMYT
jgi:hypothetical protein